MLRWLKQRASHEIGEDDFSWDLNQPEISWRVWKLLEAIDWRALPAEGGLLDQPDWLFEDLLTLSWLRASLEEKTKPTPASTQSGQIRRLDGDA